MSIVAQYIACPVCGASRKLPEYGFDAHGNMVERIVRLPILKISHNEGYKKTFWDAHPLPMHALKNFIAHMESALAAARVQLAEMPEDG